MKYSELLLQPQWYEKCNKILHRDSFKCQKCGKLGFHNSSYYECQTADELDKLLSGILLDGNPISFIIDKVRKYNIKNLEEIRISTIDESQIDKINNKLLYDLLLTKGEELSKHTSPVPIVCDCIIDEDIVYGNCSWWKNSDLDPILLQYEMYNMPSVTCSDSLNWVFDYGMYSELFLFKKSYFNSYFVRIEKRSRTGITGDQYGYLFFGHVVISICYQNSCIALFFKDQAHLDNDGNYFETPIIPKGLNIHHKYYVKDKAPWEYEDDALITLCQDCHALEHKTKKTPVYRDIYFKDILGYAQICDRCGGEGYIPQYDHVQNGICFKCFGEGVFVE